MGTHKRALLNSNAFVISGSNLERLNLFNKSTKIMIIDPTVTGPSTTLNYTQKENMSVITSDHLSVVAANYLNSAWTSAGWDVSSENSLNSGLDTWAALNLTGEQNIVRMRGSVNGSDYTLCFCYAGNQDYFLKYIPEIIAHYKLDESSGNAVDSRNGYNLTQTGSVGSVSGKIGGARGNYGNSTFLGITQTALRKSLIATSFWVKMSSSGSVEAVLGDQAGVGGQNVFKLADNKLAWQQNGASPYLTSNSSYADSNWHHIFICNRATSGANEQRMYVDSVLEVQRDGVAITASTYPWYIGVNPTGGNGFNAGYVDDVLIFDLTGTPYSWSQIETQIIVPTYNKGLIGETWQS